MEKYSESFLEQDSDSNEMEARLMEKLPLVEAWIDETLERHKDEARPVSEMGFEHLQFFYSQELLDNTKVVTVEKIEQIPVASKFGLEEFRDFEEMSPDGITYKDTYFVCKDVEHIELLHFHELVHVIQWEYLGAKRYLMEYGKSLFKEKYHDNVFEEMAYRHHHNFQLWLEKNEGEPYDVESAVKEELSELFPREKNEEVD